MTDNEQEHGAMADVWIVETGEYEGRYVVGTFATEALAQAYCDEREPDESPSRYTLWDRAPQTVTHWEVEGVLGEVVTNGRDGWRAVEGGSRCRTHWESDEVHCEHEVESRVAWWSHQGETVFVHADGSNREKVEARFRELWAEVVAGRRPEPRLVAASPN